MSDVFDWLFGAPGELSRGDAMQWRSDMLLLHGVSDAFIAATFFIIPIGIVWYMRHRLGLLREYRMVAWWFCAFIFAAGVSHLLSVVVLWYPVHGLHGVVKAVTALLSGAAVVLIWPLLPALAGLPSTRHLAEVNERLTDELGTALQRYETALRGSHVTVYTQDRTLRYTTVSSSMFGREAGDIIGCHDEDLLPPESSAPILALKRAVLGEGQAKDSEFSVEHDGTTHWYDAHIEPLRDVDGEIVGLTCAAVDITGRKLGEAHLRNIMRELTHRSKNLLAVIQAMARQTARHTDTTETFLTQFSARLQALAASHDLLVQESWHGASLAELIRSQLGHYLDREASQVLVEGPALLLKPEAAQSLGLAIHELATNAAKYGGLSVPTGKVSIVWRVLPAAEGSGVEIVWTEAGGPAVASPTRRGFGSLVVERNLARSLDADIRLEFPPEGARCHMVIPALNLAAGK